MRAKYIILTFMFVVAAFPYRISAKIEDLKRSSSSQQRDTLQSAEVLFPMGSQERESKLKFTSEAQCTVRMVGSSYWAIDGWLVGDEIYKAYQDVDLLPNDCAFPFYVTDVAIEFQCQYAGTVYVQVDVEALDPGLSTENCPYPGELLGISDEFGFVIPSGGYFLLVTTFDEPVLVTGPYFAGVYFGSGVDQLVPALITDDDPYLCVSWNDWGEGYVDLISNPYFNFPGNLVAYSMGYNGSGSAGQTSVTIYSPADSTTHAGEVSIFAAETEDTVSYEKCRFEYYSVTGWTLIGEDYSADVTLRNGVSSAVINPGYSVTWDISGLVENSYMVRAMLYRSAENFAADTITLHVDNTPLKPLWLNPLDEQTVCDTSTLEVDIPDEDVTFVQFELRQSSDTVETPLPLLNQFVYGDVDGDSLDMNSHAQGEFGDFYNGPTVVTSVLSYFADRGYGDLMTDGLVPVTERAMVEIIADSSRVRNNLGSQDDNLLGAFGAHLHSRGNHFHLVISDDLSLNDLIYYQVCRGGVVLLGVSQPYGHWLAVTAVHLPSDPGGSLGCTVYDTRGGNDLESELRFTPTVGIDYQGLIRDVDRVVAVYPRADTAAREVIGADFNASDGWSFFWNGASSKPYGHYILAAIGLDVANHIGEGASWITLYCAEPYILGDADNSGYIDIDDPIYILDYAFFGGPPPSPIVLAADADSSGGVDIDDVVFLLEYIFHGGPAPGA